jgi:hypothetical protein
MTPQEIIKRSEINTRIHKHIDVNSHEDYTNYKELISEIESMNNEVWNKALEFASENVEVNEEELSYGLDGQVYYDTVQIDKQSILKHKV